MHKLGRILGKLADFSKFPKWNRIFQTYQGQRPLTRRSTSTQKPQEQLVSPQTNSQEMEQKKSFGKQQEQQKPLKSFGFDKPTEQKPLKSSGFGNQAEEQKEPEQEQEQPEEAPKQPAIQIPRIQQPVEIRESYQCCGCQTEVPHSQLFICLLASCPYRIKEKHALHVPSQFFGQEKVFCGYCSFMGCHSPHAKQMVEALPLAVSILSIFWDFSQKSLFLSIFPVFPDLHRFSRNWRLSEARIRRSGSFEARGPG